MKPYTVAERRKEPEITERDEGAVYLEHLRAVLADENIRLDRVLSRAESLMRTELTVLTVIVATVALSTRDNGFATVGLWSWVLLAISVMCGVTTIVLTALAGNKEIELSATSLDTVKGMASQEYFEHGTELARYTVAQRLRESISVIRPEIERRNKRVQRSLLSALFSILLAALAVAFAIFA